MARDYALTRRTFGRQIGSYQAVKHKLADVYVKIENARAHATKVENELAGRLDEAAPSVARDLAASIDATVESVLARGGGTTPRLFEETDRALAREREKLEELGRVRALLGAQEERFTAIAERARIALAERAAARR